MGIADRACVPAVTLALVLVSLVAGCRPATTATPAPPAGPTPSAGQQAPKMAEGLVLSIEPGGSPAEVIGFTLRTASGEELRFRVGALEVSGTAFPAAHLHEHLAAGEPIRVTYREASGELVAVRLEDAP